MSEQQVEPNKRDLRAQKKFREYREKYGIYKRTKISPALREEVIVYYGNFCYICGYEPDKDEHLELDHWWPEALGGETIADNLRPLCPRHHDMLGYKRGRNPFYLLEALFYEVHTNAPPELREYEDAFSSLYTPDAQLNT